jgi:hypothetical protein
MRARSIGRRIPVFARAGALLSVLLAASPAIELHGLNEHHPAFAAPEGLEQAASHPGSPHHFEPSDELREPACATCALQAQARGVAAAPAGRLESSAPRRHAQTPSQAPALADFSSSSSPRGPPAV